MEGLPLSSLQRSAMWGLHLDHEAARDASDLIESQFSVAFFEALEFHNATTDSGAALQPSLNDSLGIGDHAADHDAEPDNDTSQARHPFTLSWDRYVASEISPQGICSTLLEAATKRRSGGAFGGDRVYEDWAVGPLPLPLLHAVSQAFVDKCRSESRKDDSSTVSTDALIVLAAVRLVLQCPQNHRAFLFFSRKAPPYIVLDDLKRPNPSASMSPTVELLLHLCDSHVDAVACMKHLLYAAMSRGAAGSAQSSMERSPSPSCPPPSILQNRRLTAPFTDDNVSSLEDAVDHLVSSIWRKRISEVEFAAVLGIDSTISSHQALKVADACQRLSCTFSNDTRVVKANRTDVCRRFAQLLLRYLPCQALSLHLDDDVANSEQQEQQKRDVNDGHRACITDVVEHLVQRLHSNDADVVDAASAVLGDVLVLLSRHSAVVEWGSDDFLVSVVSDEGPISLLSTSSCGGGGGQDQTPLVTRERIVVPFLDHVAMFCSTVILSSCVGSSTFDSSLQGEAATDDDDRTFGSPQRRRTVVDGIWSSLKKIRGTSSHFIQFANHVDLQRLGIRRQFEAEQDDLEDEDAEERGRCDLTPTSDDDNDTEPSLGRKHTRRNADAFAAVDAELRRRSDNLLRIADALDRLDLTVCGFLSRLDKGAMEYGFRAWLDEEDANIRSHMRYVFAARGIHASVAEGTTSVSNPSTPTSSPSAVPRSPGLLPSPQLHEQPRDFASVAQVIPITSALLVSDLTLFSRCWCSSHAEDMELDVVGTYRVWVTSGDFLALLARTIRHDDIEPQRFTSAASYGSSNTTTAHSRAVNQYDGSFSGLSRHEPHLVGPSPSPGHDGRSVVRALRVLIFSFIVSLSPSANALKSLTAWQRLHIETLCSIIKDLLDPPSPSATASSLAATSPRRTGGSTSASTTEIVVRVTLCVQALMVMVRSLAAALSSTEGRATFTTKIDIESAVRIDASSVHGDGIPSCTAHLMRPELALRLFDLQSSWHVFQHTVLPHAELIYGDYIMNRLRKAMVIIFRSSDMGQHLFRSTTCAIQQQQQQPLSMTSTSSYSQLTPATTPRTSTTPMTTPRQAASRGSAASGLTSNLAVVKGPAMQLLELLFYHHEGLLISLVSSLSIQAAAARRHQQARAATTDERQGYAEDDSAQWTLCAVMAGLLDLVDERSSTNLGGGKGGSTLTGAATRLSAKQPTTNTMSSPAHFQAVNLHHRRVLKFLNRMLSDPAPSLAVASSSATHMGQMPSFLSAPPLHAVGFGLPPAAAAARGGSQPQLSDVDAQRLCIVEALLSVHERTERLVERSLISAFAFGKASSSSSSEEMSLIINTDTELRNSGDVPPVASRLSSPPAAALQDSVISKKGQCAALLANAFQFMVLLGEFAEQTELMQGDGSLEDASDDNHTQVNGYARSVWRQQKWSRLAGHVQQCISAQQPTTIACVVGWLSDVIVASKSSDQPSSPDTAERTPPRSSAYHPHHRSLKKRHHRLRFIMEALRLFCHFHEKNTVANSGASDGSASVMEPAAGIASFGEIVLHLVTSLVAPANVLLRQRQDATPSVIVLPVSILAEWVADCIPIGPPRAASCLGKHVWEYCASSSAAMLMEHDEQVNVVVTSMAVRLLRILMMCEQSLLLLQPSTNNASPTSSCHRDELEMLRGVVKRVFFRLLRDRCTALVLREVLQTIAVEERQRQVSCSDASSKLSEGPAASMTWLPVMDHLAASLRAALHASHYQPRRIVVFSVPRRHPGIMTNAPKQFPSPDGFAISFWMRPTHVPANISPNGTMVLLGVHHRNVNGGHTSKHRKAHAALSVAESMYVTTLEVLLQRIDHRGGATQRRNDVNDDDSEGSPANTPGSLPTGKSTTSTMPPPSDETLWPSAKGEKGDKRSPPRPRPHTSITARKQPDEETPPSTAYRVYVRCPEQQFTVGFPSGVIVVAPPSHGDFRSSPNTSSDWRHVALSATYDTDHRVCNVALYIDGILMGTASMTPPKFRPGGFVVLGGGSATSNRNTTRSVALGGGEREGDDSPFSATTSHTAAFVPQQHQPIDCPELDAPFCGALGPCVLWRSHLTPQDVQFLWATPNLDAVMDMPRFAHVRALQRGRCALQWIAGRMPAGSAWWAAPAPQMQQHTQINVAGRHNDAELLSEHQASSHTMRSVARHQHKRSSLRGEFLVPNFFDVVNTLGGVSASLAPLLLCLTRSSTLAANPSSPSAAFLVPLRTILLGLTASCSPATTSESMPLSSSSVSPLSPPGSTQLLQAVFPTTLPNLLSVVLACVARSPVEEGLAAMKIISLVLPALPKGMVSAAVVDPIQTLLSDTCVDGGHRTLFHAVLHEIILDFTLWDRCSPSTKNELCLLFLEVLRKDPAVLEAASRDCARTVIPLLLHSVQTTLSGLHHKPLRKARVTAMYTAASLVPTEQRILSGVPSSVPQPRGAAQKKKYIDDYYDWIALSYVMLGQHALSDTLHHSTAPFMPGLAPTANMTASASPSSMRSHPFPISSSVSVASLAALQRQGTSSLDDLISGTRRITPSHLQHTTYLYEVLLGTLELCRRLEREEMHSAIQALVRAGLADVLAAAMTRASKSAHIHKTALATFSILLRGAPTTRLPVYIRGKHYQLFHKTTDAFALAPLLNLLPFWDPSHPPLSASIAIAILELSEGHSRRWTEGKCERDALICFAEGLTNTTMRPAWAAGITTSELAPALQNPSVLPLLVEALADHVEGRFLPHRLDVGSDGGGATANASMTSSTVHLVHDDLSAHRAATRDVLEAVAVCIASRDGAAAADMMLNPVTLHSLARIYALDAHLQRGKQPGLFQDAVDRQRIPQIVGLCCGRVLASLPETSWILLWHVVLSLANASLVHEHHSAGAQTTKSQNNSFHTQTSESPSCSSSSHRGEEDGGSATAALVIQWTASEMQLVWFGCEEGGNHPIGAPLSADQPRAASSTAAPPARVSLSPSPRQRSGDGTRSISPRRSTRVSPPTGSKPAAARIAQRMIPLCYMADVLVAQPYLYQDVVSDAQDSGSASFAACLSILSLVHHDKEVLQAFLRADCASAIVDEAESAAFGGLLEARSTLTILGNIARCALVTLREQPHRLLEQALLPLKTVLTDSFTNASRHNRATSGSASSRLRRALSDNIGINAASPPLRFITHTITQILVFSCEERRRASSIVFARDQGSIPPCAAMLLGEVCVALSLSPFETRTSHSRGYLHHTNVDDPTWHLNDADLKELCRVLHRGLGLFWEPVQRQLGRSANAESTLASWVSKSKVDVQYFFSSLVRSDVWESLQRLFAIAAGDTLHVARNACPAEVVARVQESFNRQRRIDQEIWSRLTPHRGTVVPLPDRGAGDEGPPFSIGSPTTNAASTPLIPTTQHDDHHVSVACASSTMVVDQPQLPLATSTPTNLALQSKLLPVLQIPTLQPHGTRGSSSSGRREKLVVKLPRAVEHLFQMLTRRIRRTGGPFDCWTRSDASRISGETATPWDDHSSLASHYHSFVRGCVRHRGLREVSWENYCPTVAVFPLPLAVTSSKTSAASRVGRASVRMRHQPGSVQPTPRSLCTPRPPASARGTNVGAAAGLDGDHIRDHANLLSGHDDASQWSGVDGEARRDVGCVLVQMEVEIVFGLVAWPAQLYLTSAGFLVVRTVLHDGDNDDTSASLGGTYFAGGGDQALAEASDEDSEAAAWYDQELLSSITADHNGLLAGMRPRSFMWHLSEVRDCSPGFRLRMRRTAMLLRHQHGDVVLLNFVDEAAAEDASNLIAHRTLLGRSPPEHLASAHRTQRRWSVLEGADQPFQDSSAVLSPTDQRYAEAAGLAQLWTRGSMTNFEYLMRLNTLAGRSVQDLSQYPIFPIILADYHSSTLDLTNPASFRDLRWPVGAQTDRQRGILQTRFSEMRAVLNKQRADSEKGPSDDAEYDADVHLHALQQPYHNAALYSSPSSVLHLLVRMEPYTSLHRALHDGRFDLPDRCFTSVARLYEHGSFEAVPEMFYMPDVFLSDFHSASELRNVQLPPWSQGSPWRFVAAQRVALESAYVTERLPQWIDLVFGFRQFGISAVERLNTYHPMLGESWVDANMSPKRCHEAPAQPKLEDREDRHEYDEIATLARGMWENMGQLPMQLFATPHPTPSWATSNQTQQHVAQQRQRQQLTRNPLEQLTRRLRGPTALIESIARGFAASSGPSELSSAQRPCDSIAVAPAARIVVDYLPHPSGKLFILLDNGCVAVTSWKGIPTAGIGSTTLHNASSADLASVLQDAQFFGSCAPDDAIPLCLINASGTHYDVPYAAAAASRHHKNGSQGVPQLVEGRYPVHVLYTSRRRRHLLILASLTCADGGTLYASNTLEAVVPIPVLTEDCTPGTEAAVVRAVGIHCAERDVFGRGGLSPTIDVDEVGGGFGSSASLGGVSSSAVDIIAVSQSDGALTLWKCGEANTAHAGLTCMGSLVGHACAVVATDINVIADVCVSVSRSATPRNADSGTFASGSGGWRVLLHTISTKECIAELPVVAPPDSFASETVPAARRSSGNDSLPPSIAVLHAPYPLVLVSTHAGVFGYHPSSGFLLFHQPPAAQGICRLMIRRVVDLSVLLASANVTTVFREWDQESVQEALVSRLHSPQRKGSAVTSSRTATPRVPPSVAATVEGSPTTSGGGPITRRQSTSVLPSVNEREVAVLSASVVLDVRSKSTVGPSAIRAIAVSLLSNGTFTLFV
jgi:hypothetical protein